VDVRISATNGSDVALKVADIDGIEPYLRDTRKLATHWPEVFGRASADDGRVESDICLSQTITDEIRLVLQYGLNTVKRIEERHDGILICLLALRETSLVNAIYNDGIQQTSQE
jgi:hypothetical protein